MNVFKGAFAETVTYKVTFYSRPIGSPYCVFGCQLQVVVFLSAHSLIQFWTDTILNVQIFRCVWTHDLAENGLWECWNKFHMNLFCPVLCSRKKKVRWGDVRKNFFFFCIQLGLAVVMTTDLVMNPCSAVCKTFAALLSPYMSHFPYLPAGHDDHLIEWLKMGKTEVMHIVLSIY